MCYDHRDELRLAWYYTTQESPGSFAAHEQLDLSTELGSCTLTEVRGEHDGGESRDRLARILTHFASEQSALDARKDALSAECDALKEQTDAIKKDTAWHGKHCVASANEILRETCKEINTKKRELRRIANPGMADSDASDIDRSSGETSDDSGGSDVDVGAVGAERDQPEIAAEPAPVEAPKAAALEDSDSDPATQELSSAEED